MPAALTFPTLVSSQDSKKYRVELDDNTMSEELEGGYTVTRARTTRRARRTWNIGYTEITDADKIALENFFGQVLNAVIFNWTNTENNVVYQARFVGKLAFE